MASASRTHDLLVRSGDVPSTLILRRETTRLAPVCMRLPPRPPRTRRCRHHWPSALTLTLTRTLSDRYEAVPTPCNPVCFRFRDGGGGGGGGGDGGGGDTLEASKAAAKGEATRLQQ